MWECPKCHKSNSDSDDICVDCGIHQPVYQPNYCTNPTCTNHKDELKDPQQRYCDKCHSLTTFGKILDDLT